MKSSDIPSAFAVFTEIGIISQLSSSLLEKQLPDGLKISQFGVLSHLVRLGGEWSPVRLANAFQVTKGAMTNTIKRLEARGLIDVIPDPEDGRGKLVRLNKEGEEMYQQCIFRLMPEIEKLMSQFSSEFLQGILPPLQELRQYLDENR
ncbi:MarR family transcriptional regulator [Sneathiella sp. P13V-1]|uniref:MarR family winged helix-turn-helix transcriptional regulator n=1 Tax=Sneathiella sp. P13V-1 TaxID=2697366 RepID=UPI00187B2BDB|nr:MarR family transcriptional regulator [Sneathiella sp. P13V-1]MBE7635519.1 MarR family transcriptional regulator [Sneathiella sp. P13V-1]